MDSVHVTNNPSKWVQEKLAISVCVLCHTHARSRARALASIFCPSYKYLEIFQPYFFMGLWLNTRNLFKLLKQSGSFIYILILWRLDLIPGHDIPLRGVAITSTEQMKFSRTPLSIDSFTCNTQQSQETNTHASGGTRTRNPSKRTATTTRLRPRIHWDRR
jgi:hypothetical protein